MTFTGFPPETFAFLAALTKNNERDWFQAHRDDYDRYYVAPALSLVAELGPRLQKISRTVRFEPRINGSLFRINRDVRFSKDKSPYKNHIDLWFWEGQRKGWDSPGFWFRLLSDRLMIGAGMHGFEKATLERYRKAVVNEKSGKELVKLAAKAEKAGYEVGGASRKSVPRGMDPDHPRARFLLHEGLYAGLEVKPPKEAKSAAFVTWCVDHYKKQHPISAWIGEHVVG